MLSLFSKPRLHDGTNSVDGATSTAYSLMQDERKFNSSEAQLLREWQENMSNTAYQRQVEDMKKAGLNPYIAMSGGSGAVVPSGASAYHSGISSSALSSYIGNINTLLNNQTSRDIAMQNNITKLLGTAFDMFGKFKLFGRI